MSFPPSINNFKHLTSLVLEDYFVGDVPESISSLSLLQKLDLTSGQGATALPRSFSKLTNLKNLTRKILPKYSTLLA